MLTIMPVFILVANTQQGEGSVFPSGDAGGVLISQVEFLACRLANVLGG